jgi:multidrug efflux pump subunit AcrA (membrane-fusion protein)
LNEYTAAGQSATGDVFLDAATLSKLRTGTDFAQIAAAWLAAFAKQSSAVEQGLVVMAGTGKTRFEPVAIWPEAAVPASELMRAVEGCLKGQRMIIETGTGRAAVAVPLMLGGQLRGVLAILASGQEPDLRLVIDQLQWASGWLEAVLRRQRGTGQENLVTVIELLATSLHHERFGEAATAVATELAGALGCEVVGLGMMRGRHVRLRALSNSAVFGKRATLVGLIEAAMDEAVDQQAVIVYPAPLDAPARVRRAHDALAKHDGGAALCTIPLTEQGKTIGALLLERSPGQAFEPAAVQMAEQAAVLIGPVLDVKRREDRWLPAKTWDAIKNLFNAIFGPRHAILKLSTICLIAFAAFCYFAMGTYRVTATTSVEGRVQRVVTAPLAGFLVQADVRAGDRVTADQIMAQLEDRDVRLERLRWASDRTKQQQEYSQALAQRDRTKVRILASQIEQSDAQIAILDQQLERMTIRAPFAGLVVSGDLSQALGAPLERGDVLFQVAPLDEYRMILRIDERDIRDIAVGQTGPLVLAALPDTDYQVTVKRITPISSAQAGANVFDVEAALVSGPIADLRPGMEGVAKIEVDERRLISIWTRRVVLWAQMTIWSWKP